MSLLGKVDDKPLTPGRCLTFGLHTPMESGACGGGLAGISSLPPPVSRLPTPPRLEPVQKLKLPDSELEDDEPLSPAN